MASSRRTGTNEQISTYGPVGKDYEEGELSLWEEATDTDHVTDEETDVLEVYKEGAAGALWTDIDIVDGSTNNSSYFRIIRPASGEGHSGIPKDDGSIAGFKNDGTVYILGINESYSQMQDLCIKFSNVTGNYYSTTLLAPNAAAIGMLYFDFTEDGGASRE